MPNIGLDIGTKTIVVSFKNKSNKTEFIAEINGYWPFDRATPFIENMLNDPKKTRSDGTQRPARWLKLPDHNKIIILGGDAEEFAYAKNDTLLRPMANGGISPEEEAMTILSALIHGLLTIAEKDIGEFKDTLNICYCTTADALNENIVNIPYHKKVVELILNSYETKTKKHVSTITESHAIVLNMSHDGTGIGISWGAGTVTVSYVKYGMEIYSFCWVGAGDWIDTQVALRHGYSIQPSAYKKPSKETPTTISRRKLQVDLTPNIIQQDRILTDIALHYQVLINNVISGIVGGFEANEAQARIEQDIDVYMAGGTSLPKGFTELVKQEFMNHKLPFSIGDITRAQDPLYCVAEGCLKAAEMS